MSNAITGSVALTELKSDLTQLSTTLHEVFDLMNADMSKVGDAWQDGKYQEFVDGYRPQIQKCEDISVRYSEWCKRVLDPTIDNVIAVERTDVGSGSGSIGGVGAAGAVSSGSAAVSTSSGKAGGFNMGGAKTSTSNASLNHSPQLESWMNEKLKPSPDPRSKSLTDKIKDLRENAKIEDKKNNFCYTSEQKEGRLRTTKRIVTETFSNTKGTSINSGSTSETVGNVVSVGTNTSASSNINRTYNSGSSTRNNSSSDSNSVSTEQICVDLKNLPEYGDNN